MIARNTVTQPIKVRPASSLVRIHKRRHWFTPMRLAPVLVIVPLLLALGCATVSHNTVPKELVSQATVPDMPDVRAWGDEYSDYDRTIQEFYTTITTKDIYRERSFLAILFDPSSMVDTTPLQKVVAKQVDAPLLAAVAQAYQQGRRLFIGTTNMEAGRFVIWDMGAIAASDQPWALELFRKVMLASAAIPVAFPPMYIPVEADGRPYEEMHVDGGTAAQVFFYGFTLDLDAAQRELGIQNRGRVRLFIVRNGKLTVPWKLVSPRLLPIADRSLNGLIGSQVVGDLYRIYTVTQREGIEFNLAYIPDDYDIGAQESFDQEAMKRLFQLGYEWARAGYPWQKLPPGLRE